MTEHSKLRQYFSVPYKEHGSIWDQLWEEGSFLPWDRGQPSPPLADALAQRRDLLGPPVHNEDGKRRKRALVPGCGKGYDVLLLAGFGYDAYGLDVSKNAIVGAQRFGEEQFASYTARDKGSNYGCGTYHFVEGDFFKDDWVREMGAEEEGFDLIFDYTFFCALPPETRPSWALRMTQLLAAQPFGRLICLEWPNYKDPSTGGPPFGVKPDAYVAHLSRPGEDLPYTAEGYPEEGSYERDSQSSNSTPGLVRLDHWQPERTHPAGKGSDWVSVWGHK